MDILRDPVWSRQDADLGMCRVDGVYIVTVCIRAHYICWSGGAPGPQAVRSVRVLLRLRPRCCSGGLCGCGRAVVCSVVVPCVDWCSETPMCVGSSPRSPEARQQPTERRYWSREIQTEQKTRKFLTSAGFPSVWCILGIPRRPTDRMRSSDEHTNKREVELTSISQQTTTEGTPLFLLPPCLSPEPRCFQGNRTLQSHKLTCTLKRGQRRNYEANSDFALLLSAPKKIAALLLCTE